MCALMCVCARVCCACACAGTYAFLIVQVRLSAGGPLEGSTFVTISGQNFAAPLGNEVVKCLFGGVEVNATVISSVQMICVAPVMTAIGPKTLEITLNGVDKHVSPVEYTYYNQAILRGLMPPGGPSAGGTIVTISGVNFADGLGQGQTSLDGNTVKITSATNQTTIVLVSLLIDAGTMLVTMPALTPGLYTLDIAMNAQNYAWNASTSCGKVACASTFLYYNQPLVVSALPAGGPVVGATSGTHARSHRCIDQ